MKPQASAAISTPLVSASVEGEAVLSEGGSAIDAAITANAMLAVCFPHMCGLGGDLFAVVGEPSGSIISVNGSGSSSLTPQTKKRGGETNWGRGAASVTLPGAVGAWTELHQTYGRLPLARLLEPAIRAARDGFFVGASLGRSIKLNRDLLAANLGARSLFFSQGEPIVENSLLKQPALAETLTSIVRHPKGFYGGHLARKIVAGLDQLGVELTENDFQHFTPILEKALGRSFTLGGGGFTVSTSPPNSQGVLLLGALGTISRGDESPDPFSPKTARLMALTAAKGALWRSGNLADPRRMKVDANHFLEDDAPFEFSESSSSERSGDGDTVAIVASDSFGLSVSMIQSLYSAFGSGLLETGTGVLLQNRGDCFDPILSRVNSPAAGMRPAHSLSPVIVEQDDAFRLAAGTMGGLGQPQILTHVLLRILGLGESAEEAVAAPRWLLDAPPLKGQDWTFVAENDVPDDVIREISNAGFRQREVQLNDDVFGHTQVVQQHDLITSSASDKRADGIAKIISTKNPFSEKTEWMTN